MKKKYLLALLLPLLVAACHKKDSPAKTPTSFTGTWQEKETDGQFAGSTYRFVFTGTDSFRLSLQLFSDVIVPNDSCSSGHTVYTKGTYKVDLDTITLTGKYYDESFNQLRPDCDGRTDYADKFIFEQCGDTIVLNSNVTWNPYAQIKLVKQ